MPGPYNDANKKGHPPFTSGCPFCFIIYPFYGINFESFFDTFFSEESNQPGCLPM